MGTRNQSVSFPDRCRHLSAYQLEAIRASRRSIESLFDLVLKRCFMSHLIVFIRRFFTFKEDAVGATMVEYGLMVALIAVVSLTAVSLLGTNIREIFNQIAAAV